MTFEQWWDTVAKTPAPDTFKNWEESCRQAWAAGVADEHARIVKRLRDEATYACPCADDANLTNELADILAAEGAGGFNAEISGERSDSDGLPG